MATLPKQTKGLSSVDGSSIPPIRRSPPRALTAKDVRQLVLSGSGPIVRDLLRLATGTQDPEKPGVYFNVDEKARDKILDIIRPMLQAAGEVQVVTAQTHADLARGLAEGKITIGEAKELMQIFQMQFEMDELKSLAERLEGIGPPNNATRVSYGA